MWGGLALCCLQLAHRSNHAPWGSLWTYMLSSSSLFDVLANHPEASKTVYYHRKW